MKYYKRINENKDVSLVLSYSITPNIVDPLVVEITEDEYNTLLSEIQEKAGLVEKLYCGEITIEDVPADWQEEIQRRVDEMIAEQGTYTEQEISADELQTMIEGVL